MATFDHYKQVIPADFYSVTYTLEAAGLPDAMLVTHGFGGAGYVLTAGDLNLLYDAFVNGPLQWMSTEISLTKISAYDANGIVDDAVLTTPGIDVGAVGPASNAIIVQKRTATSGRRFRGRCYMPGVEEAHVGIDGTIAGAQLTAVQTLCDSWLVDVQAIDALAEMVLLHSKGWNDPDPEPADPGNAPAPTVVTALVAQSKIGTQRRRIR